MADWSGETIPLDDDTPTSSSTPTTFKQHWFIGTWHYKPKPELCFIANTAWSTIKLGQTWSPTAVTLETSADCKNWNTYTIWDTITLSNVWDRVYWRNTSTTDTWFSIDTSNYYNFIMSWSISATWNVNYLLNKNNTTTLSNYCFYKLFYECSSLITAPKLIATALKEGCYSYMFYECRNLKYAPSLPSATAEVSCCSSMFERCFNLETLPKLEITPIKSHSCYRMFYSCSKIKISETQTWEYQTPYSIPSGAGSSIYDYMFKYTWWTFTDTPYAGTYYTSNEVAPASVVPSSQSSWSGGEPSTVTVM